MTKKPRLTSLPPRLASLPPRLGSMKPATRKEAEAERHRQRDDQQAHRRWYKTARWQRLRMDVLHDAQFTCQMAGCGQIYGDTSKLVADHKTPHHGDEALFWDKSNLQCLCKPCHDRLKQREERGRIW